jgi:hypothetical protein
MMPGIGGFGRYGHRQGGGPEAPVELRFVDLLLIVVATVMFMAVLLTVVSAFTSSGQPDVAPRITTTSAPSALVGEPYQLTLAALGEGQLSWRLVQGTLPEGLALNSAGVLQGTAGRAEQQLITVGVQDSQHRGDQRQLQISTQSVGPAQRQPTRLQVTSPTILLPGGTAGQAYRYTFGANSGTPPLRWQLSGGALPSGLSLASDGNLVGSPNDAGTGDFVVSVTDSTGASVRQQVRLEVLPAPSGWWGTFLTWLLRVITWLGYALLLLTLWTIVFGAGPSEGHRGLIHLFRA